MREEQKDFSREDGLPAENPLIPRRALPQWRKAEKLKGWAALVLLLCFLAGWLAWHQSRAEPELRIGLFAGSNWDVPSGESYAVIERAVEKFRGSHPGVKVTYVSGIKREDYGEWLAEQLLAGKEPDVFLVSSEDFDAYADIGILRDLTDLTARDTSVDWKGFYPAAAGYGRHGNQIYALPVECAPTLMFVNKTLLAREGVAMPGPEWTWQDFYDICARVTRDTDGDGQIDQYGVYGYNWRLASLNNGLELFSPDGKASYFADSRMGEALKFLLELSALTGGSSPASRDVDLGRVAFRPFTFAEYRTYKPYPWRIKKFSDSEWDCVRLPRGPEGKNISPVSTLLFGMSARTEHVQLAWDFLKVLSTDKEIQHLILEKSQGLPVRREVVLEAAAAEWQESVQAGGSLDLATISSIMDEAVSPPKFRGYGEAMLFADNEIQHILAGSTAVSGALHKLQKDVNAYLQR